MDEETVGLRTSPDPASDNTRDLGPADGPEHVDVTALRDALLEKVTSDWDYDIDAYFAARRRLEGDLDALIAAVHADATRATDAATDNTRILLASRPNGEPTHDNFRLETSPIPSPGDGEVLLRTIYLSLDPYMRGRMNDAESYAAPQELGEVMQGGTVAEVIESNDQSLSVGDLSRPMPSTSTTSSAAASPRCSTRTTTTGSTGRTRRWRCAARRWHAICMTSCLPG